MAILHLPRDMAERVEKAGQRQTEWGGALRGVSVVHLAANLAWVHEGTCKFETEKAKRARKGAFDVIPQVAIFPFPAEGRDLVKSHMGALLHNRKRSFSFEKMP